MVRLILGYVFIKPILCDQSSRGVWMGLQKGRVVQNQ